MMSGRCIADNKRVHRATGCLSSGRISVRKGGGGVHVVKAGLLNSVYLDLLAPFENMTARIGVIGLGYVGIPLTMAAVESGFRVVGFDIDAARVAQINRGV